MRILVVEDSPAQASILSHVLKEAGHEVLLARDGLEGIEAAYREQPHCIISDIVMPRMNGWQLIRFLKSDVEMRHIPIVLMTTREEATARLFSRMSGANYYLPKQPFSPDALLDIVQRFVPVEREPKAKKGSVVQRDLIITRINELLDRELLRSSIFNEIAMLSREIQNLPRTCLSILKVLEEILGFDLGAFFIAGEGMFTYVSREVSEECVAQLEGKMLQKAKDGLHIELSTADTRRERFGCRTSPTGGGLQAFYAMELREIAALVGAGSSTWSSFHPSDLEVAEAVRSALLMVAENALLHKKTQAVAITDGLTSLFTHRHLQESLDREIHRARRFKSQFSVLLLDIDDFKKINDTYGHLFGDQVLRELAQIVLRQVRETDVVGRYGGEEFMVILSETDRSGGEITAERIRRAIALHIFEWEGEKIQVSVSGGLATFPLDAEVKRDLVAAADSSLYRAKTLGKNRIEIASKEDSS